MNNTNQTLRSISTSLLLCTWLSAMPHAQATTLKSAADCNAANLSQALLGISMSQNGIVNNANVPLFVVCSVDIELLAVATGDVAVEASFPAAGGTVSCTLRSSKLGTPGFDAATMTITSGQDDVTPAMVDPTRGANSVDTENGAGTGATVLGGTPANNTVVCALDPGEGITFVFIN